MAIYDRERSSVVLPQLEGRIAALERGNVDISSLSNNRGAVDIGDIHIEWGLESVTSSSTGSPSGDVTLYLGTETVTFSNKFKNTPVVIACWSGNYVNQVAVYPSYTSTTGFTLYGRMLTGNQTRSIRWLAIGQKA